MLSSASVRLAFVLVIDFDYPIVQVFDIENTGLYRIGQLLRKTSDSGNCQQKINRLHQVCVQTIACWFVLIYNTFPFCSPSVSGTKPPVATAINTTLGNY